MATLPQSDYKHCHSQTTNTVTVRLQTQAFSTTHFLSCNHSHPVRASTSQPTSFTSSSLPQPGSPMMGPSQCDSYFRTTPLAPPPPPSSTSSSLSEPGSPMMGPSQCDSYFTLPHPAPLPAAYQSLAAP